MNWFTLLAIGCLIAAGLVIAIAIIGERYIRRCEYNAANEFPLRQTTADVLHFQKRIERRRAEIRQTTKGASA